MKEDNTKKQVNMEEEDKQLYRRNPMTGQARDAEDNQLYQRTQMTRRARNKASLILHVRHPPDVAVHVDNIILSTDSPGIYTTAEMLATARMRTSMANMLPT